MEEDPKEQEIMKPYVPLRILCISAYLEQHAYENEVFDSTFSSLELLKIHLLKQQPDVIGMYTNLMTKLNVLRIIRYVKDQPVLKHSKIILGGPEVRNHVNNFLKSGADILVLGEGEQTMLELVQFFDLKSQRDLEEIQGIAFLNDKKEIIQTVARTYIRNLQELPLPNRKKVNLQLYFDAWKSRHGESAISVSTMRGCPYTCKWCSRAVYGQTYRRRTPKQVVEELAGIQRDYTFDTIWFVDDVFTISHQWLREFVNELKSQAIQIRYECITR